MLFKMYRLLILAGVITFLIQCKSNTQDNTTKAPDPAPADTTIEYNELSSKVLGRILRADTSRIKKLFTTPVKIKIEEKQEEGGDPYYFYTFTNPGNKITLFYKPNEGFYIENGLITGTGITLNKDVTVGMDKATFLQLLEVKSTRFDVFRIVNDDATVQSTFYFKNAKLFSVALTQTVE